MMTGPQLFPWLPWMMKMMVMVMVMVVAVVVEVSGGGHYNGLRKHHRFLSFSSAASSPLLPLPAPLHDSATSGDMMEEEGKLGTFSEVGEVSGAGMARAHKRKNAEEEEEEEEEEKYNKEGAEGYRTINSLQGVKGVNNKRDYVSEKVAQPFEKEEEEEEEDDEDDDEDDDDEENKWVRGCNATASEVFMCSPEECVPLSLRCNGVTDCSKGQDESVRECGCLPNEFECEESCIDETRRCDTFQDCPDGADELKCDTYVCPATYFKCNNHFCVPSELVCDFDDHCGDRSDEQLCHHRKCWKAEFECANGQCIRPGRVCDGVRHCKDGTDEDRCSPGDFAVCGSGSRVHRYYWCDGWPDCADNHADELHCGACEAGQGFRCPSSRCILASNVCDSFCDCLPDCSDEAHCSTALYTRRDGVSRCEVGAALTCLMASQERSRDRCIASQHICDGTRDCHNGQYYNDEFGCDVGGGEAWGACPGEEDEQGVGEGGGGQVKSRRQWYLCGDGRCLPAALRCDFKNDCLHGDDEEGCEAPACGSTEWRCESGQCIPADARCDLAYTCMDKSDEIGCEAESCASDQVRCDGGQCLNKKLWCDWVQDCPDGSDEKDCGGVRGACGLGEFRCSSGQCVEDRHRCDASVGLREGCADLSHLLNCSEFQCGPGLLKCSSGPCLNRAQVCDGFVDCPLTWDDEDNCPMESVQGHKKRKQI